MTEAIETIIIGGGQSGLAMSYWLAQLGREHLILEQGRLTERWRSQRWDSLHFQFPRWSMQLPGYRHQTGDPDGFAHRDEVVSFLEGFAASFDAPIRSGIRVRGVEHESATGRFLVDTDREAFEARNVVIATGVWQQAVTPALASDAPRDLFQLHTASYRNPEQLPPGAVLIVGSAASGCQIAEDLVAHGRQVLLSVGSHSRVPRRYRGQDFTGWGFAMGRYEATVDQRPPGRFNPLLTGVDGGHTVDIRRFADDGVTLLGRVRGFEEGRVYLAPDARATLAQGDESLVRFMASVDEHVRQSGLSAPEEAVAVSPDLPAVIDPILDLDLRAAGVTSIIWATGYRADYGWLKLPVFDEHGRPLHRRGVTFLPGLYFLGLMWQYKAKSAFLWGIGEDAAYLAEQIAARA
jgi:putative flavoprotein involved in K+ transport